MEPTLSTFLVVAAVLTITPGADTMLILRNVLQGGRRDGLWTMLGICSGLLTHAVLSALGLSVILSQSATIYQTVKLAGALYLCWLGAQSIWTAVRRRRASDLTALDVGSRGEAGANSFPESKDGHRVEEVPVDPRSNSSRRSIRGSLTAGLMSNLLNPKVAIFYLAFLPQFIGPNDPVLAKSVFLGGLHWVMGVVWLSLLAFVIDWARSVFLNSRTRRWLEGISGAVLMGLGLRLAVERR